MIDFFTEYEWLINFVAFTIMMITMMFNDTKKISSLAMIFVLSFSVLTFSIIINVLHKGF